ncbi:MBL fold metallo-hydrolase [Sulfuracidifex tepidarius]|uniref:Hydroxyacylglutathione hydrolase n=1 Tax=Sulfuracidifex tepidarius TaxID=1294262 RepID=A0A510E549_9CREN|nr:MBL fold metallo-hydrolase [Sulfuracidifex tepidarius]BBG24857.1 Hydroxyacylglutathione hydrolase [Sulfuracidifex tepidarius]BBG27641.1 Hydroxyacylglutathione hydrolase [Sulfuracidifex tepidarius]
MRKIQVIKLKERDFFGRELAHNVVLVIDGDGVTMIDTSLPENFDSLAHQLKELNLSLEDVSRVVLSHSHPDHVGNAEAIRRISGARVYAHREENFTQSNFNLSYEEVNSEIPVSREEFDRTLERINQIKMDLPRIDVKLEGGEDISGFRVLHTPGHTPGHIALFDGENLVAGDAIRNENGLMPPLRFFNWNNEMALKSFNFLTSLPYKRVIPYHG